VTATVGGGSERPGRRIPAAALTDSAATAARGGGQAASGRYGLTATGCMKYLPVTVHFAATGTEEL